MKKETAVRLRRIYDILLCVSIFLAGICLIAGCISIYLSGDQPYSREAVAEVFAKISLPVYACLVLTVGGFIWELFLPSAPQKQKPAKTYGLILGRLKEKKALDECDEALRSAITKERNNRRLYAVIRAVILCVGCAAFLIYALNPGNFDRSDINGSMIGAMRVLLPCLAVPFAYAVFTAYHAEGSIRREIELLRSAPDTKKSASAASDKAGSGDKALTVLRILLLLAAVAVLIYGFIAGGTADVLTKAINICTECIGLG